MQNQALAHLYRRTKDPRRRTRAQMVFLAAEHGLKVPQIAAIVRESEATVLRWRKRSLAEGLEGWPAAPRPGHPSELTAVYRAALLAAVRRRPRRVHLPFSVWTLQRPGTIYVAWENADTHHADEVEAVVRAAAGRLVLLYVPTDSPWLNPVAMRWRPFRREVAHGELFASLDALLKAAHAFFDRDNHSTTRVLSIIGAQAA
jgi:transposase